MKKKILSLTLALVMALSATAAFAEPAETAVGYASFAEHLEAFLSALSLDENDLSLQASDGSSLYALLLDRTKGVCNLAALMNANSLAHAQFDDEAAYLSIAGQDGVNGIRYATVQSVLDQLTAQVLEQFGLQGVTLENVQEDISFLGGWLMGLVTKLGETYEQSGTDSDITLTLNAPLAADVYADGIDELIANPQFEAIIGRYGKLLGVTYDQVKQGWASERQDFRDTLAKMTCVVHAQLTENGEILLDVTSTMPVNAGTQAEGTLVLTMNGGFDNHGLQLTGKLSSPEYPDDTVDFAFGLTRRQSLWSVSPDTITFTMRAASGANELAYADLKEVIGADGQLESYYYVVRTQEAEVVIDLHDDTLTISQDGNAVITAAWTDSTFTMAVDGVNISATWTEISPDQYQIALEINDGSQVIPVTLTISFADVNGVEALYAEIAMQGETVAAVQLNPVEKTEFPSLKDGSVEYVTEEQLMQLLQSAVSIAF